MGSWGRSSASRPEFWPVKAGRSTCSARDTGSPTMRTSGLTSQLVATAFLLALSVPLVAQQATRPNPKDTEVWGPVPAVVTPGAMPGAPPADAIVLFDG